jgi:hypothetical protein
MKASSKSKILNVFKYTMASLVVGSLYLSAQAGTVMDGITITQEASGEPVIIQVDQTDEVPAKPIVVQDQTDKVPAKPIVVQDQTDKVPAKPIVVQDQDTTDESESPLVIKYADSSEEVSKVPTKVVTEQDVSKVPPKAQATSSWTLGSVDKDFKYLASQHANLSPEKQYSCLERFLRYAGNKRTYNDQYKRVYNMFWNGSKDQSKLIAFGAEKRGFTEDNVREIIEVGFKRGDFCPVGGKLFNDKAVENYVMSFSKSELDVKEVAMHDRRDFSCKDEYIWEHVRDRATKKGLKKGAAIGAIYGGLTGNGPVLVAALGTGLFGLFHKSSSTKVAMNYSLMKDSDIPAEHKEYARIYREVSKLMGQQLSADPKVVEQLIADAIEEGFQSSEFCRDGQKLYSSSDIRKFAVARIAEQYLGNADTYKVAGKKVIDQERSTDPLDQTLEEAQVEESADAAGDVGIEG